MDVMLDLETMGTQPSAAIIAIGAVEFDFTTKKVTRDFYRPVTLKSSVTNGGVMDPDTVMWWLEQSDSARAALKNGVHINEALMAFSSWLYENPLVGRDDVKMWGNGADFDNVVLATAYARSSLKQPWSFRNNRCYRTVKARYPHIPGNWTGVAHNAVDDARNQAVHLMNMMGGVPHG